MHTDEQQAHDRIAGSARRARNPYEQAIPPDAVNAGDGVAPKPKINGDGVPDPESLREFIAGVSGALDRTEAVVLDAISTGSGKVTIRDENGAEQAAPTPTLAPEAVIAKVLAFLDNKMRGPITLLGPIRHKLFVFRIPAQQEMIQVAAFAGTTLEATAEMLKGTVKVADQTWTIVGELQKACVGWIPERSPSVAILQQNINDPTKWPELRETNWLATRDPYVLEAEVYPLWKVYQEWRRDVVPTPADIDFYYANQG